jgi:putative ABC transport system substrate-binding protein
MKKLLIGVVLALVFAVLWYAPKTKEPSKEGGRKTYKIALLSAMLDYHQRASAGFMAAALADPDADYQIVPYDSARADYQVMNDVAKAVALKKYDAIVTVGARFSQLMAYQLQWRSSTTPMIFIGVARPVDNGCVESEERPGGFVNGVRASRESLGMQLDLLLRFKPDTKKLLLTVDSVTDLGAQVYEADAVAELCAQHGIEVLKREITQTGTAMNIIRHDLMSVDAIMIAEGSIAGADITGIAKLCDRYEVPVFAGDPRSADEGAAVTLEPDPYQAGVHGFARMRGILRGEIDPATTPIEILNNARKVVVNFAACKRQGLEIDPILKHAVIRGELFIHPQK